MKKKDNNYRACPYCKRRIPSQYSFKEHKYMCRNTGNGMLTIKYKL